MEILFTYMLIHLNEVLYKCASIVVPLGTVVWGWVRKVVNSLPSGVVPMGVGRPKILDRSSRATVFSARFTSFCIPFLFCLPPLILYFLLSVILASSRSVWDCSRIRVPDFMLQY